MYIRQFDLSSLLKAKPRVDPDKFRWFNHQHVSFLEVEAPLRSLQFHLLTQAFDTTLTLCEILL